MQFNFIINVVQFGSGMQLRIVWFCECLLLSVYFILFFIFVISLCFVLFA